MSHSRSLLDAVTRCGGMGVSWGRLGTAGQEREERKTRHLNDSKHFDISCHTHAVRDLPQECDKPSIQSKISLLAEAQTTEVSH